MGLGDADRLAVLQGCPGIPGTSGPKGEPGLPGTKGEATKARGEHCNVRWLCCLGRGEQAEEQAEAEAGAAAGPALASVSSWKVT